MFTVKWDPIQYPSKQFGIWRMAFGFFLTFYFLRLLPYATEVYSSAGAFPHVYGPSQPALSYFPDFLLAIDSPFMANLIVGICAGLGVLIMIGFKRKGAAFFLWLLVMWLYNRNPLTDSPDYEFVNWLIFVLIFIPDGEVYSIGRKNPDWKMPMLFYWGAWIILSLGYLYAASSKLKNNDPSWLDGSAMYYILASDNSRLAWYGDLFQVLPRSFFLPITWSVLVVQGAAPFFAFFRTTRPWWWLMITAMQIGILLFINVPEVTFGMLLYHAFLWDQNWMDVFGGPVKNLIRQFNPSKPRQEA